MNDGLIPQRYAKALFKYALDRQNASQVYDEMKQVIASFEANPDLSKVLANPFAAPAEKEKLMLAAAGDRLEDDYRSFVKLILEHKRADYAYLMALAYRDLYRKANKIAMVNITTASDLAPELLNKLKALVQNAYKDMTLEFAFKTNPELIGGFVIDVDSNRLDASISNEIEQLRLNLLSK